MFWSLFKFKLFKYYVLIIFLILLVNLLLLLHVNFNSRPKKPAHHYGSDIYEERGFNKINKKYLNNAKRSRYANVSNDIHRDILYELDILDKYFLVETGSEFIQNKFKNLVSQMKMADTEKKLKSSQSIASSHVDELNSWLLHQDSNPNLSGKNTLKYYLSLISKIRGLLCAAQVVHTDLLNKGTQLKLLLSLSRKGGPNKSKAKMSSQYLDQKSPNFDHRYANTRDHIRAVFKPKWYNNSQTFPNVVDGKDRHYGELIGFHLSVLLELYRTPLTVLTEFKMLDLVATASDSLNATFFSGSGNSSCFQGKCLYCTREAAVCSNSTIAGALILYVENEEFQKTRNPYQRSYIHNVSKAWETDHLFCFNRVAKVYDRTFILDLVDIAVFDFLLQNGDRHHLEKVNTELNPDYNELKENFNAEIQEGDSRMPETKDTFLLFDNGKSFGNPALDNLDILAPLYQCCIMRSRTYNTLVQLRGGLLVRLLKSLSKQSACKEGEEVLNENQWSGLQRRLNLVYATVNFCVRKHHGKTVLVS